MGTFTALGDLELGALADVFGLGALRSWKPIAAGTINSNFAIESERGRFFLRVNEGKAEADVAWEARLVGALAAAGIETPPPLHAKKGSSAGPRPGGIGTPYAPLPGDSTKWVSAFAWRPGVHLAATDVTPARAHTFGRSLAELHVAALALPADWRRRSIYDHDHLLTRFAGIERVSDPALAHAVAVLRDELAVATQAASVRAAATAGIIHGDLFRDNVLWDGERISAVLDFEQASGGSLAYDLAVCLNDWCWTDGPRLELADALLTGYQQVRELSASDRAALPYEIRAAAARFTITRITDVYLAKVTNPEKDFRAFLARTEAWQGQYLGQLTRSV